MKRQANVAGCVVIMLIAAGGRPAAAASITSDDFVAIARPTADFLVAASDLALSASESRAIRAAARSEAAEARAIAAEIAGWRQDESVAEAKAAQAPTIDRLGPIASAISVPLEAVARTASAPSYFFTRLPSADRLDAAGQADLARLAALAGPSFDSLYVEMDLAALRRLERVCRDFVLNGDDPTLRALAVHALPKLQREIAVLERR